MTEVQKVMKACQVGCRNLNEANDLLAECYGLIGRLSMDRELAIGALNSCNVAFDGLFSHCLSNGIFNAWQKPIDCSALNEAYRLASEAVSAANKPGL